RRLKSAHLSGRTVMLKLKSDKHKLLTRSRTLNDPTQLARRIFETGLMMLKDEVASYRYWRLIGIGVDQLDDADHADPVNLADPNLGRVKALEDTVDGLRKKHGNAAIVTGRQFASKPQKPDH
ncbi:MAG: DNA polymerase IV, partial [Candidatus Puniceispirillales bacterium]